MLFTPCFRASGASSCPKRIRLRKPGWCFCTICKTAPPQNKYNAAQRIAYTAIIVMGFGSIITGLAIYKPVQFYWLTWICGGYHFARILHFALTLGYVLFFIIHVVQVILAGWNNFRSVISGFETVDEPPVVVLEINPEEPAPAKDQTEAH